MIESNSSAEYASRELAARVLVARRPRLDALTASHCRPAPTTRTLDRAIARVIATVTDVHETMDVAPFARSSNPEKRYRVVARDGRVRRARRRTRASSSRAWRVTRVDRCLPSTRRRGSERRSTCVDDGAAVDALESHPVEKIRRGGCARVNTYILIALREQSAGVESPSPR